MLSPIITIREAISLYFLKRSTVIILDDKAARLLLLLILKRPFREIGDELYVRVGM